jgi:hypothetical protein
LANLESLDIGRCKVPPRPVIDSTAETPKAIPQLFLRCRSCPNFIRLDKYSSRTAHYLSLCCSLDSTAQGCIQGRLPQSLPSRPAEGAQHLLRIAARDSKCGLRVGRIASGPVKLAIHL